MSRIRDIDIEKVLIDSKYKPYLYEALIELDKEFDINGWSKFLKPNHIENIYNYSIGSFDGNEMFNDGGEVDFENKIIKLKNIKDISVLKHELMHALKGEKIISGVKHQGVKIITPNSSKYEIGRNLEEYLNEMMSGGKGDLAYRDGTAIVKLLYSIVGDTIVDASLNNDRTKLEDLFYNLTGSDEFLTVFEDRLSLISTKNVESNEVYMLSPAAILIGIYTQIRKEALENINLTKADVSKMLEQDNQIRNSLKDLGYENLSNICLDLFDKKISDLYKSDAIYELDYEASVELEKNAKLISKRDLSQIDYSYEDSALNDGDILRKTYEMQIAKSIDNNQFPKSEKGLRKFIETMIHFQKDIAVTVEENKQKLELLDMGIPTFETDPLLSEDIAFSNEKYIKIFEKMSEKMYGYVNDEFIKNLSNPNLISDSEISKTNLEKTIKHYSNEIENNLEF